MDRMGWGREWVGGCDSLFVGLGWTLEWTGLWSKRESCLFVDERMMKRSRG